MCYYYIFFNLMFIYILQAQSSLLRDLSQFGLVVESARLKRRRADLETQLREVEEAIEVFSRRQVYVNNSGGEYDDRYGASSGRGLREDENVEEATRAVRAMDLKRGVAIAA